MKRSWLLLMLLGWSALLPATELDDLVRQVQEAQLRDRRADEERRTRFLADKSRQQKLLGETKEVLAKAEAESQALRETFSANQTRIKELDAELKSKSGELTVLFGTVREQAGKLQPELESSLISAQYPGRTAALATLAAAKQAPSIAQLEGLWATLLQEMNEAGKTVRFPATVSDAAGVAQQLEVYRVGPFSAFAGDKYLRYAPEAGKLVELPVQPESEFRSIAEDVAEARGKFARVAVDPARGAVLEGAARVAGYPWLPKGLRGLMTTEVEVAVIGILLLASVWALAVACERWLFFRRVDLVRYSSRVELETDLTRHLTVIGTVAANAPFVGLLGTVLGVMLTFQKMGASEKGMDVHTIMTGLSVALKATAMGLLVAIPCVILNNLLRRRIRELATIYEVRHGS